MSLRYTILAVLLDGDASGYELAKRFDISVANFWHALPQQLYPELTRLERKGMVTSTTVIQEGRPNKRVYSISQEGRQALLGWLRQPSRITAIKDEFLVRVYAGDLLDLPILMEELRRTRAQHEVKLGAYERLRDALLQGRPEGEYLRTERRVGPYLTLQRGIMFERENIAWCTWVEHVLRQRVERYSLPSRDKRPKKPSKSAR